MSVTLSVSNLTDAELRIIGEQHTYMEELEAITKVINNDKFREGLLERSELSDELIDYILKTRTKGILKKFAQRNCNTRSIEQKLFNLQCKEIDNCLMMNPKLHEDTLKDLSNRYSTSNIWQDNIFFHDSAGDYVYTREFNKIKEFDFEKIMESEEKLIRIAERTASEEILKQLSQIELWESYSKYKDELENKENKGECDYKKKKIDEFLQKLYLKMAENHNCNEKTLHLITKNNINVHEIDEQFIKSILNNPKTCGLTIAYIVTLFNTVDIPACDRFIKVYAGDILSIIRNHFDNVE